MYVVVVRVWSFRTAVVGIANLLGLKVGIGKVYLSILKELLRTPFVSVRLSHLVIGWLGLLCLPSGFAADGRFPCVETSHPESAV